MNSYDLPTSLNIGGVEYRIRYNWRAIIDILSACADTELDEETKAVCLLHIFYPDLEQIPPERITEAYEKACKFIDCGQREDGPKPKMIDWEQDALLIIPEVNKIAGREVRLDPDIHWWTFFGWFMQIGEGLLGTVIHIRGKKAKHKKLDKFEQEFYRDNKSLVDFTEPETEEIRVEKDNILKWL